MTLERCRRILCGGVRQEDLRWPPRFQALLKVTTTTGRLQRLLRGASSASRFGGAFEEGARAAGAVALFCAFLKVDVCRLDFTGHRADDLPAYLVIVIVGHVLVPVILWVEVDYAGMINNGECLVMQHSVRVRAVSDEATVFLVDDDRDFRDSMAALLNFVNLSRLS